MWELDLSAADCEPKLGSLAEAPGCNRTPVSPCWLAMAMKFQHSHMEVIIRGKLVAFTVASCVYCN